MRLLTASWRQRRGSALAECAHGSGGSPLSSPRPLPGQTPRYRGAAARSARRTRAVVRPHDGPPKPRVPTFQTGRASAWKFGSLEPSGGDRDGHPARLVRAGQRAGRGDGRAASSDALAGMRRTGCDVAKTPNESPRTVATSLVCQDGEQHAEGGALHVATSGSSSSLTLNVALVPLPTLACVHAVGQGSRFIFPTRTTRVQWRGCLGAGNVGGCSGLNGHSCAVYKENSQTLTNRGLQASCKAKSSNANNCYKLQHVLFFSFWARSCVFGIKSSNLETLICSNDLVTNWI